MSKIKIISSPVSSSIVVTLLSSTLLFGCGGGGSKTASTPTPTPNNPQTGGQTTPKSASQVAMDKIVKYAQDGLTAPKVVDYKSVGVSGVTSKNVSQINTKIRSLKLSGLVNSKEKLQAIVNIVNQPAKNSSLKINEVLAANTVTNMDTDYYAFSDWIELVNTSKNALDIGGFYLSDDNAKPKKWMIPNGTKIAANAYLMIWADDQDKITGKELHASFKLSAKGETLTLANKNGEVIDSLEFKKQASDISTARINNKLVALIPTPNKKNGTSLLAERSKSPSFSFKSGFYDSVITLTLTQENSGVMYYTTDGSEPSPLSTRYKQAISLNKTTVVRALSFETGKSPSQISSNTYFINHQSTLPVISLTTNTTYLFDDKVGIHTVGTNGTPLTQCDSTKVTPVNYAHEWERPVHLEYFDETHTSQFSFGADMGITGQCSRDLAKKSLSFELNTKYGTKTLEKKLYPNKDLVGIKDFKLRMGNDGYEIGDILAASVVEKYQLDIDYQAYRTVQMFMNGEYWGIYNIREKKGKDYLRSNYPDLKKVDIVDKDKVKKGDLIDYNILINYLKANDLSKAVNYQKVIQMVDEKSFIDYMAFMIYTGNIDWIGSNHRSWKEKKVGAKWRWILDDIDYGFKHTNIDVDINVNLFEMLNNSASDTNMVLLFKGLLKNNNFKQAFKTRFNNLLLNAFNPANLQALVTKLDDERKLYIPLEKEDWDIKVEDYTKHINDLRLFSNARPAIVKAQLDIFIP